MIPSSAFAPPATIPELTIPCERSVLDCGAVLLVSRRPGAPVCAMQLHVRGGPALDPVGREGTTWLAGGLADQGTARHSEEQIAALLEPEGGELSGDASGLGGSIVNERWELLADVACDALTGATYPEREFQRQKKRVEDRLQLERDDPRQQGGLIFRRLVYGKHWLGRAAHGTIASVRKIRARDLRTHRAANWVGKRTVISVCGDVDPARVRAAFARKLRRFKSGMPHATATSSFPPLAPRTAAFHAEREQVHLYLGHLGIQRKHPNYAALVVMDHVLGTGPGFTNRISRRLRDEQGLAYSVQAAIHSSAGVLPGTFTAYIGTSPKNARRAIVGFREEIELLRREPVGAAELDVAKSYLLGSFPLGFERAGRRAGYLVASEVHGFGPGHLSELLHAFAAVTPADVLRVAAEHLHPERSCVAAAGPLSAREVAELAHAGPAPALRSVAARRRTARLPAGDSASDEAFELEPEPDAPLSRSP